jgi:hypothetical protein
MSLFIDEIIKRPSQLFFILKKKRAQDRFSLQKYENFAGNFHHSM